MYIVTFQSNPIAFQILKRNEIFDTLGRRFFFLLVALKGFSRGCKCIYAVSGVWL
jgi:hypothetical protein